MPFGPLVGAALVGGASSLLGGILQNKASKDAASTQMAFQRESAQNQYQWAMDDMRKAGLNPILAYKQGGSGTLGGSSYNPVNVGAAAAAGALGGASSALSVTKAETEQSIRKATVSKLWNESYKAQSAGALATQEHSNLIDIQRLLRQDYKIKQPEVSSARALEQFNSSWLGQNTKKWDQFWKNVGPGILGGRRK